MFDAEGTDDRLPTSDDLDSNDRLDEIIWHSALPDIVRHSPLTYSRARILDSDELERICGLHLNPNECSELAQRLSSRRNVLGSFLGEELTCAVVRLPGGSYTVEVSLDRGTVVHWEWLQD